MTPPIVIGAILTFVTLCIFTAVSLALCVVVVAGDEDSVSKLAQLCVLCGFALLSAGGMIGIACYLGKS